MILQMKGIDALNKKMRATKVLVYLGGGYLKKTIHILTKLAKISCNMSLLSHYRSLTI